jgi:alkylation response protein AidB-like acyl-CoA dehydrogenase
MTDKSEPLSHDVWMALASFGALVATIPEVYGGVGVGLLELCIVAEQIGRSFASVPFLSTAGPAGAVLQDRWAAYMRR